MQRLQLARVFYHRPDLIVLDEASSALDQNNEMSLMDNLKRVMQEAGSVVIMAAHRSQVISSSDLLIDFSVNAQ